MVGNTVYSPPIASLPGQCKETVQVPLSRGITWLGSPTYTAYWLCGKWFIAGLALVFLAPSASPTQNPNAAPECHNVWGNDPSRYPPATSPLNAPIGLEVTHFAVPKDWGGRLDVVYEGDALAPDGLDRYFYADNSFFLKGNIDGCSALAAAPVKAAPPPGSGGAGYPWANAPCEFGTAGGSDCHDPKDPRDRFLWYVDENGNGRLDISAAGRTCGTQPAASGECFDQWGYNYRNCTSYVAWRLSVAGAKNFASLGDASLWVTNAKKKPGVIFSRTASVGAVAVWTSGDHVAYVDSLSGGVQVSDFNGLPDFNGLLTGKYGAPRLVSKVFKKGTLPDWYITFPRD